MITVESELIQCIGYNEENRAYKFKNTGIRVYSFEEALFHCYYNWNKCIDEFLNEDFIEWVKNDLKLSKISLTIREIEKKDGLADRFLSFLKIIYYFDEDDIKEIEKKLREYESRNKIDILKENADEFYKNRNYAKAKDYYIKALRIDENNYAVLNNMGLCEIYEQRYGEAAFYFRKAFEIMPGNFDIIYNLIEAYVFAENYNEATYYLKLAERYGMSHNLFYFYGEIEYRNENYLGAANNYVKALEIEKNDDTLMRLCDSLVKLRRYKDAVEAINKFGDNSAKCIIKRAEIFVHQRDVSGAIKTLERAIVFDGKNSKIWTKLAKYYTMANEYIKAEGAANTALNFDKENFEAELELARAKKALGKDENYNCIMKRVIDRLKWVYRKLN